MLGRLTRRLVSPSAAATRVSSQPLLATAVQLNPWFNQIRSNHYGAASPAPAKFTSSDWHSTTILCVRKDGRVCMMGDGMVSMGNVTIKPNAKKIRRIFPKNTANLGKKQIGVDEEEEEKEKGGIIVGFAGSTADAFTLLERLEGKIDEYPGQLARSCVELAKGWRTDKYLRRLEASLLVADEKISLEITGNGDVLESHDGVLGVGSGAFYAIAAARALVDIPDLTAEDVAERSMKVAANMCVYTNTEFIMESIKTVEENEDTEGMENGKKE